MDLLWDRRAQVGLAFLATGLSVVRGMLDPIQARLEANVAEAIFLQDPSKLWVSARAMLYAYGIRASITHVIDLAKAVGLETFRDHLKGKLFRSMLSQDIEW